MLPISFSSCSPKKSSKVPRPRQSCMAEASKPPTHSVVFKEAEDNFYESQIKSLQEKILKSEIAKAELDLKLTQSEYGSNAKESEITKILHKENRELKKRLKELKIRMMEKEKAEEEKEKKMLARNHGKIRIRKQFIASVFIIKIREVVAKKLKVFIENARKRADKEEKSRKSIKAILLKKDKQVKINTFNYWKHKVSEMNINDLCLLHEEQKIEKNELICEFERLKSEESRYWGEKIQGSLLRSAKLSILNGISKIIKEKFTIWKLKVKDHKEKLGKFRVCYNSISMLTKKQVLASFWLIINTGLQKSKTKLISYLILQAFMKKELNKIFTSWKKTATNKINIRRILLNLLHVNRKQYRKLFFNIFKENNSRFIKAQSAQNEVEKQELAKSLLQSKESLRKSKQKLDMLDKKLIKKACNSIRQIYEKFLNNWRMKSMKKWLKFCQSRTTANEKLAKLVIEKSKLTAIKAKYFTYWRSIRSLHCSILDMSKTHKIQLVLTYLNQKLYFQKVKFFYYFKLSKKNPLVNEKSNQCSIKIMRFRYLNSRVNIVKAKGFNCWKMFVFSMKNQQISRTKAIYMNFGLLKRILYYNKGRAFNCWKYSGNAIKNVKSSLKIARVIRNKAKDNLFVSFKSWKDSVFHRNIVDLLNQEHIDGLLYKTTHILSSCFKFKLKRSVQIWKSSIKLQKNSEKSNKIKAKLVISALNLLASKFSMILSQSLSKLRQFTLIKTREMIEIINKLLKIHDFHQQQTKSIYFHQFQRKCANSKIVLLSNDCKELFNLIDISEVLMQQKEKALQAMSDDKGALIQHKHRLILYARSQRMIFQSFYVWKNYFYRKTRVTNRLLIIFSKSVLRKCLKSFKDTIKKEKNIEKTFFESPSFAKNMQDSLDFNISDTSFLLNPTKKSFTTTKSRLNPLKNIKTTISHSYCIAMIKIMNQWKMFSKFSHRKKCENAPKKCKASQTHNKFSESLVKGINLISTCKYSYKNIRILFNLWKAAAKVLKLELQIKDLDEINALKETVHDREEVIKKLIRENMKLAYKISNAKVKTTNFLKLADDIYSKPDKENEDPDKISKIPHINFKY